MNTRRYAAVALAIGLATSGGNAAPAADGVPGMSGQVMGAMQGMDDAAPVGNAMLDQLEADGGSGDTTPAWDAQAWYGGDYDKIWLKSEGTPDAANETTARNELLWDHVLTRWWDLQAGVRCDVGQGPARGWAALGVEGIAPYWFEVEATLYVGEAGRTAARLRLQHDLLITQRLVIQPEIEANAYGKSDPAREVGSGLSDLEVGVRARYEIRREFAPYLGVVFRRSQGTGSVQWVAGLRAWL